MINQQRGYWENRADLVKYRVEFQKWITWEEQYLLAMDTMKMVIGRKQYEIEHDPNSPWVNACHYYGLWAFSGNLGPQKYRKLMNL